MHILYLSKSALPAESSYCGSSHYSYWPDKTIGRINVQGTRDVICNHKKNILSKKSLSLRTDWTSPQNSDARHPQSAEEMLWAGKTKPEMVGFYLCWWIVMGIEEKGERQRNERSVSEENITFYQLYLHKLKCRQFTTEQWVSEKATYMGSSLHFHIISLVGRLPSHQERNSISQPLAPSHWQPRCMVQPSVTNHKGTNIMSDSTIPWSHSSAHVNSKCKSFWAEYYVL